MILVGNIWQEIIITYSYDEWDFMCVFCKLLLKCMIVILFWQEEKNLIYKNNIELSLYYAFIVLMLLDPDTSIIKNSITISAL